MKIWERRIGVFLILIGLLGLPPLTYSSSYESISSTRIIHSAALGDGEIDVESVYHFTRDPYFRSPGWGSTEGYNKSGAVQVGTNVRLRLQTKKDDVEEVSLILLGMYPNFTIVYPMTIAESDNRYDYWEGQLDSPTEPNECAYYFKLQDGDLIRYYMDSIDDYLGGIGEITFSDNWVGFPLIYHAQDFTTPEWHRNVTVGYQIFLDRFFNGDPANDAQGNGTTGDVLWWEWDLNGNGKKDGDDGQRVYATQKSWNNNNPDLYDFYGGDFAGILEKLDYLAELGVDMIYLNPFTESPDNHGYSVVDYYHIDPYYSNIQNRTEGVVSSDQELGIQFFDNFTAQLKDHGIRLIFDAVINHCAAQSTYFQRFEHSQLEDNTTQFNVPDLYPEFTGAYESTTSQYSDWFQFYEYNHNYAKFDGQYDTLPTFQYAQSSSIEEELITGPYSIFQYWIEHGVDGFRLDVNQDYEDGQGARYINALIRTQVKAQDSNQVVIGEVWDTDQAPRFLTGLSNDGVQNMAFMDKTRKFVYESLTGSQYENFILSQQELYPPMAYHAFWSLLGNHDTTRIFTYLFGEEDLLKMAATLQMTTPGVPIVYYGDEVGLHGGRDPDCRRPFPWGEEKEDILSFYQNLSHFRTSYDFVKNGGFEFIEDGSNNVVSYARFSQNHSEEFALIMVNKNNDATSITLEIKPFRNSSKGDVFFDWFDPDETYFITSQGTLKVEIPGNGIKILIGRVTISTDRISIAPGWFLSILLVSLGIYTLWSIQKIKKKRILKQ